MISVIPVSIKSLLFALRVVTDRSFSANFMSYRTKLLLALNESHKIGAEKKQREREREREKKKRGEREKGGERK